MSVQLKSERLLEKQILNALAKHATSVFTAVSRSALNPIKRSVEASILNSHEVRSLSSGDLRGELGLRPSLASTISLKIAQEVSENVFITPKTVKVVGSTLRGGLELGVMPSSSWPEIWGMSGSKFKYYSQRYKKVVELNWLHWLLNMGDSMIVKGFDFVQGPMGRSGKGKMVKNQSATWSVPSKYSGTTEDNFITRALEDKITENAIAKVLEVQTKKHWG